MSETATESHPQLVSSFGETRRKYRKFRHLVQNAVNKRYPGVTANSENGKEMQKYRQGVLDGAVDQEYLTQQEVIELEDELAKSKSLLEVERTQDKKFGDLGFLNENGLNLAGKDVIETIRKYGISSAVVSIDCDRLKEVNDTLTSASGDKLLETIAQTIHDNTRRNTDIIAHVHGDEFWVLLPGMTEDNFQIWKNNFNKKLEGKKIGDFQISASMGFAEINPNDFEGSKVKADQAMNADKDSRGVRRK